MSRKIEMNVVSAGWTQMELVLLFYGWEACDPAHYWGPGYVIPILCITFMRAMARCIWMIGNII